MLLAGMSRSGGSPMNYVNNRAICQTSKLRLASAIVYSDTKRVLFKREGRTLIKYYTKSYFYFVVVVLIVATYLCQRHV